MSELNYGVNVENLLHDLSQHESSDIGEFDVYGEDEQGREGCASIDITLLASDALKVIASLKAQRDALAAENANLLLKAASELSNAWVLHKYWIGIHAALMHMQVGRSYEAEQWLKGTIAGPGLEAPNLKLSDEIDAWANEQNKDSISHLRALEIIKAETPATDSYLNSVRAEGADTVAKYHFVRIDALKDVSRQGHLFHKAAYSDAVNVAKLFRAGKDGE